MTETGEMGLPYITAGSTIQSLARTLVDRGFDEGEVLERLENWANSGHEDEWWERWGGPAVDSLAYALGYESAFPEEDE